jgi:hypothetical protein
VTTLVLSASLLVLGGASALARASTTAGSASTATAIPGSPAVLSGSAVVNFSDLAGLESFLLVTGQLTLRPAPRTPEELDHFNESGEPGAAMVGPGGNAIESASPPFVPFVASPPPTGGFVGLDDIPMVDSMYIVVPPDVGGAVGPTRILSGHNNNYRVFDKATGATLSTVGTATFWGSVVAANERLALTDPRTAYDPYNNRFIAVMQTVTSGAGKILVGISQTSDPQGAWNLYSFNTLNTVDYPILGFNKNWISVSINRYSLGGTFQRGINLVVDYPQARAGTGTGTIFTLAAGTGFCASPCLTYSSASESLFVVTHLSSAGATYTIDWITGTSGSPTYVVGNQVKTRTGGAWVQPNGNQQPQSAPNSGASACGSTPCPIESQDSQVRSAPSYRDGLIYYAQTVGLPSSGQTHTGVQWTILNTAGSATAIGNYVDGGRIEDATATGTNGGKWYDCTHLAVNANHDFMVGYTQLSSAQHPSTGYSVHMAGDAAGSIRDVVVTHAGEDYYHKTFSTTTGRNRWGDFSTVQVDPSDDMTLWALQEFGKTRPGTDDGNTGSNSSRWSTWWSSLAPPSVTIDAGPSQSEGNSGTSTFNFTARLSYAYGLPVTVHYQTSDGTATVADNDYQAANSSVIIPAGSTTATIPITVNGDLRCESDETFSVTLSSPSNNIPLGLASVTTGTITNDDDSASITSSAGAGGSIAPNGTTPVTCGGSQLYTITPDAGFALDQLLVDGSPVTPAPTFTFTGVVAPHTISASFVATTGVDAAPTQFALGSVLPNPARGPMQVAFGLPAEARVSLSVVDLQGREVAVLARGDYAPGWHFAKWDGRTRDGAAGAGLYFVRYQAAGKTIVRKFALTR